jgi:hypothetical protein
MVSLFGGLPSATDILERAWRTFVGGPSGPLKFRFLLQPLMALLLAMRAGRRDARLGHPPFLWGLVSGRGARREYLLRGWKDMSRVFVLAVAMDLLYQFRRGLRPSLLGALLAATVLAIVPYLLLCGPVNRIARRMSMRGPSSLAPSR